MPLHSQIANVVFHPVGWGCRMRRLPLCSWLRLLNECPGYDTEQSDGGRSSNAGALGIRSTPTLPSLSGPLRPLVVAPDRILSMGQLEVI